MVNAVFTNMLLSIEDIKKRGEILHRYLRAIGFSKYGSRDKLNGLIRDVIINSNERSCTINEENILIGEFCKDYAENIGIAVCGEFDNEKQFTYDYSYPYLRGTGVTTRENISIERHASKDSYAGICDDMNVGVSMIFYLQNFIPYLNAKLLGRMSEEGISLTLSGLSVSGMIMMPIKKDEQQKKRVKKDSANRSSLLAAARKGDEDAIETLTLEDMDMYTTISRRIQKEDIFSMVDTYFMPYGVECDQYSIMGEIQAVKRIINQLTSEEIFILTVCCNELVFDICINSEDLYGEPQPGRRFKGVVWLQGHANFHEIQM